jgi:phosphatidylglycerol:prolipoprotein diacylglycerol transferase
VNGTALFIPWFKLEALELQLPWVGEVAIQPFGVLAAAGILVGAHIAERRARACGVSEGVVADLLLHAVPLGLVTAYLLNAVFYDPGVLQEVFHHPGLLLDRYLGLSSYGGFLGGIAGAIVWRHRRRMSLLKAGDPVAYAFPAGWFFGRTGCFLIHDHPGVVTDFPLAVDDYWLQGVPRHDLGLYEAFWSLVAFLLFLSLGRKPRKEGFFLAWLPLLYAPVRFLLDFLREGPDSGGDVRYLGLTPGQYGSLALLVVGLALANRVHRGPGPALDAR